jgi:hypothetical protein
MKKFLIVFLSLVIISFSAGCQGSGDSLSETQRGIDSSITLNVEPGISWQGSMKILFFSIKKNAQMAAWITDENGNYVSTISVTERSAKKNWKAAPNEGRPEALPVWNHALPKNITEDSLDVISSATAKSSVSTSVDENSLIPGNTYNVFLEINHSFDYNDTWTEDNSGVNGQPSLIYQTQFVAGQSGKINLALIGHGSVDGSNGNINPNLEHITSALSIIENAWIDAQ